MAFFHPIWWIVPSLAAGLGTPTLGDWANAFASIDRRLMETWGASTGPTTYARARRLDDRFGAAPSSSAARAVIPPGCPVTCAPDGPYTEVSAVPMPWFRSRPFPFDSFQSRRHPTTHPHVPRVSTSPNPTHRVRRARPAGVDRVTGCCCPCPAARADYLYWPAAGSPRGG